MIGYFGDLIFESSDKRVLTFNTFNRTTTPRWEEHNVIQNKPVAEFIGADNDLINFNINLNAALGVNPLEEADRWREVAATGEARLLVIGDKALGTDLWRVMSVTDNWGTVLNDGSVYSTNLTIALKEYQSSI